MHTHAQKNTLRRHAPVAVCARYVVVIVVVVVVFGGGGGGGGGIGGGVDAIAVGRCH